MTVVAVVVVVVAGVVVAGVVVAGVVVVVVVVVLEVVVVHGSGSLLPIRSSCAEHVLSRCGPVFVALVLKGC